MTRQPNQWFQRSYDRAAAAAESKDYGPVTTTDQFKELMLAAKKTASLWGSEESGVIHSLYETDDGQVIVRTEQIDDVQGHAEDLRALLDLDAERCIVWDHRQGGRNDFLRPGASEDYERFSLLLEDLLKNKAAEAVGHVKK